MNRLQNSNQPLSVSSWFPRRPATNAVRLIEMERFSSRARMNAQPRSERPPDVDVPSALPLSTQRKSIHATRGITLLEVMIAAAMATVILGGLWSLLTTFSRLYQRGIDESVRLTLVRSLERQLNDDFELGVFHDELMAKGWLPLSLIRWEMTGLDDEVRNFWRREPMPQGNVEVEK